MFTRCLVCGIVSVLAVMAAVPQSSHAQFEELQIHLGYTQNINRILLHDKWEPGWGPELAVATPFYFGYAEGVVAYHMYGTRVNEVPPFNALMIQVGWGVRVNVGSRLQLDTGLRIGNYGMQFRADNGRERAEMNESELHMALQSRAAVQVYGPWSLHISGSYQRTFIHHRMDLVYVSFGLSGRIATPEWLRDFLQ